MWLIVPSFTSYLLKAINFYISWIFLSKTKAMILMINVEGPLITYIKSDSTLKLIILHATFSQKYIFNSTECGLYYLEQCTFFENSFINVGYFNYKTHIIWTMLSPTLFYNSS